MANKFKACSVAGCNKNAHYSAKGAKGYCGAHYNLVLRHGVPASIRTAIGEPLRFVREVALIYKGAGCLIWPYTRLRKGYGQVRVEGKMVLTHRYVCALSHGEPPTPTHEAAHSCGNGHLGCINPNHLGWKTPKENYADKLAHGTSQRGERSGQSKLTEPQVREIRSLRGVKTQLYLSSAFGVNKCTISSIQSRRSWGWLE